MILRRTLRRKIVSLCARGQSLTGEVEVDVLTWFPPFENREGWGTLSCGKSERNQKRRRASQRRRLEVSDPSTALRAGSTRDHRTRMSDPHEHICGAVVPR
jgi:hypothetical protein